MPAAKDLNFRSPAQLKEFCHSRGVRTASLDEQHTERYIRQLTKKLAGMQLSDPKRQPFIEVLYMLQTKQELGGSSLSKLQTIIDTIEGGRLARSFKTHREHVAHVKSIVAEKSSAPGCPKCGSVMVARMVRKGANAGRSIWGCSRYPACRGLITQDSSFDRGC